MEGPRHLERVTNFITKSRPDCLALQEMPESYGPTLTSLGYHYTFAAMSIEEKDGVPYVAGIAIATRTPHTARTVIYFGNRGELKNYERNKQPETVTYPYISALVHDGTGVAYQVVTTHLIVTPDGREDDEQNEACVALLAALASEPPHAICGDFNMPRGYNTNYERFTKHYTDTVPTSYTSSLDREFHRCGNRTDLNAPIFDIYMVDYLFTQDSYRAENVRLEFGISDHAALLADLSKT